jgi:hypothetical protein
MENEKNKFEVFECVRMTGATNMVAVNTVIALAQKYFHTDLTRQDIIECLERYDEFANKYLDSNTIAELRLRVDEAEVSEDLSY